MIPSQELAKILATAIASSISILFVAVTFLISQYEQNKHDPEDEWLPYARSTRIMNYALAFAVLGFFGVGAYVFGISEDCILWVSSIMLAIELLLIIGGIMYVSHQSLEEGLHVWR